jgi:hypothetical protein
LWVRRLVDESPAPWADATDTLRAIYGEDVSWLGELEWHVRPDDPAGGNGSGYVVDCLRSARWAFETEMSFEGTVKAAISLGNDTDTTACVAGGVAGARFGIDGIPKRWRDALRGRSLVDPLLERLLARVS